VLPAARSAEVESGPRKPRASASKASE